jgi:hypothetical protein
MKTMRAILGKGNAAGAAKNIFDSRNLTLLKTV